MASKYVDTPAIVQVIGSVYQNPSLLDNEKYSFTEEDFTEEFHKVIFGSIYNLHKLGAKQIDPVTIEDYLQQRPKKLAIYKTNNGSEYLNKIENNTQLAAFDYYYKRMKKMTLFRMYKEKAGLDLSWLYDIDNIFDQKKKQAQEDWLDNTPIEKIAEEGYDKAYGARPLRRAIQSKIEDAFAEEYLLGKWKAGDKVSVGLKTNGFSFRVVKS